MAKLAQAVNAIEKHFAGKEMTIDGVAVSADSAVAQLKATTVAVTALNAAKAAVTKQISTTETQVLAAEQLVEGLRKWASTQFSDTDPALVDFGLKPKKPRKTTSEANVAKAAKAAATREARHTLGPKAKLKIHGTVPAPTPSTPPTPPTPPSASTTKPSSGS